MTRCRIAIERREFFRRALFVRRVNINKFIVFVLAWVGLTVLTACGGSAGAIGWSGAALDANALFYGGNDAYLYKLDAATGAFQWVFPKDKNLTTLYATPVVANGLVYIGGYDGVMRAIDANSGDQRWQFPPTPNLAQYGPIVPTVLLVNNIIYYGDNTHNFYALDANTGAQKWKFQAQNKIWSSAVHDQGTIYFGVMDHKLYALDANTGAQKWTFAAGGLIAGAPRVQDGVVYVGALNMLHAVDAASGQLKWTFTSPDSNEWIWAQPTVANNTVYIGTLAGNVYALDVATGNRLWTFPLANRPEIRSAIVVDGDVGYFGAADQNVYAINLSNGQLKWKTADKSLAGPIFTTPTLRDGILYIPVQGHNVYALNAADGSRKWCFDGSARHACGN